MKGKESDPSSVICDIHDCSVRGPGNLVNAETITNRGARSDA